MAIDTPSIEKRSKKDKKEKKDKKSKSLPTELETIVPTESEQITPASGSDDSKASKKKSKKRKHADVETEAPNEDQMVVDSEPALEPTEKKKKKKKMEHEDGQDTAIETTDKKEKKKEKKRKEKEGKAVDTKKQNGDKKKSSEDAGPSQVGTAPASSPAEIAAFLTKNNITIHVPSSSSPVKPFLTFAQLPIPESLRTFSANFKEPSPVQACTWPPALEGKDVVGIAETGSGKTLAFGVPALTRLISSPPPPPSKSNPTITTLVLAPTRELAIQTHEALEGLGQQFGIASVAVFGGVPKEGQVKMLKNLHKANSKLVTRIIVGTPGRILDLMSEGACDLSGVDFLVLDEADRMLDKGFENDIRKIISNTKPQAERQTLMFSATWPEAVRKLASTFQNDPIRVTVGSDDLTANSHVEQVVEVLDDSRGKDSRLLKHLRAIGHKKISTDADARILVFALYKAEASRVESMLRREGYAVGALHGDLSQNNRLQALEEFKSGKTGLLVATDVAARGLDIPNVGTVINYTFPLTIEDYIHRIGRTGRGGNFGKSITFFTGENQERGLAGELSRVLNDSGFSCPDLKKFPMTIKKKEHGSYGAFFRDDIPVTTRKKIVF
ncbi:P-loop containing nucleoside triphosphate hydrolase protein [Rhodocollybia butyracea]|uniref:RNA helicase n=1 Tax=Rhodocollybia butyracea TaxID=206335 RepID=A0A9P5P5V9_9AGAR|nr:P-loop containing nucleoside triphosphate hydrolase protein [Rhodocollybia butyracea]